MGKETEEESDEVTTPARKTLKERGLIIGEAGPDHPVYRRGWTIGGTSLKKPLAGEHDEKEEESEQKP